MCCLFSVTHCRPCTFLLSRHTLSFDLIHILSSLTSPPFLRSPPLPSLSLPPPPPSTPLPPSLPPPTSPPPTPTPSLPAQCSCPLSSAFSGQFIVIGSGPQLYTWDWKEDVPGKARSPHSLLHSSSYSPFITSFLLPHSLLIAPFPRFFRHLPQPLSLTHTLSLSHTISLPLSPSLPPLSHPPPTSLPLPSCKWRWVSTGHQTSYRALT